MHPDTEAYLETLRRRLEDERRVWIFWLGDIRDACCKSAKESIKERNMLK
jgi:hypothetical protein